MVLSKVAHTVRVGAYSACGREIDRAFVQQLASWTLILLLVKAFLALPLYLLREQLTDVGNAMFRPLWQKPKTELTVVMVLAPCLCNIVQFWVYDQIIKRGAGCRIFMCCKRSADEGEEALLLPLEH